MNIVEARELKKHFKIKKGIFENEIAVHAVDGVDITIRKGETLGLVGESGCGKTTTCKLILRLIEPDSGRVCFDGTEITALEPALLRKLRPRMQMIFQDISTAFDPRMRISQIISEPLEIREVDEKEKKARIAEALRDTEISASLLDKYPHQLSTGQKQRVGIARALILKPELVVADEPVSHLDISIQAQILTLLKELKEKRGLSYLFVAHDLKVVRYIAERVAVMYLGKIVETASCEAIFTAPRHPYTKALLASGDRKREKLYLRGEPPRATNPPLGCRFHTRCSLCERICIEEEPETRDLGEEHSVACHFAG